MKIRYYLRGLGLGILVTAIFFMVSGNDVQPMSDEMIKARARELGMSESVVLSELSGKEAVAESVEEIITEEAVVEPTIEESVATEETVAEDVVTKEAVSEEAVSEEAVSEEPVSEETVNEESNEEEASLSLSEETSVQEPESVDNITSNTETVTVTVNRGEGSDTVSRRLQEAGLVADAHEYDKYLMANGYDKRIGVGEHVIPAGATWEDIAKILCNMK